MKSPLLELKNINLEIDNFSINNVSLSLSREIHMIMGENGSESILMEMIMVWYSQILRDLTEGQIVKPRSLSFYSSRTYFYSARHHSFENLSIAENLYFHNLPFKTNY